ncbi:hypothetical protein BSLG_004290 [Batrachochytrium salamandrivorans]|nr:hypothetical protein BSLG_004290 [Batrachochytrium salamandrivorans]
MDDRLAIKDPFYHAISVVDPITDDHSSRDSTSMSDTPISYDHDGLCRYARMVLFVIGLLKDNVVEITSEYTWIWVELLRFAIISDHLFFLRNVRTDPMLWNADCGIASRHLADEVRVLIAEEMEISPYSLSEYAEAVTFGLKSSMSALDTPMIFVKALECALCEDTQLMSDATRFSYVASFQEISHSIFTKYLESEDDTTMWMDVYSNLVKKQEGHRPCTIAMRVSLGPLLRQVKSVTDAVKTAVDAICKYDRKMIQNVDDEFKVYKHALKASPMYSYLVQFCYPLCKEILKARAEQAKSQSSCSSSSIATDLNLAVVDPIGSHRLQTLFYATVTQLQLVLIHAAPPGIAMTKFLVDLVHYRLEGLARQSVSSTSLSPSECVLLYHTLLLWQGISAIASTDQLEWVEMADIDWSISRTCLRLLVAISSGYSHTGEDMDGDLRDPMVQIQHLLCECVANLEYGKEDTISATTPDMIRPMMFAHDTVVQLTAWRMMHQYTAHTVCTRSLLVEMALLRPPSQDPSEELSSTDIATASNESSGSAHGNAEIHSDQLPATLIAGLSRTITTEHSYLSLGYLISWMIAFDNFENATFQLKLGYITQLRSLDLVPRLLEFCFGVLGVGVSGQLPFNLTSWDFQSFEMEGYDAESENSLQLLSAHVYWRAIRTAPSLVRIWWSECKNRQLSLAVESITAHVLLKKSSNLRKDMIQDTTDLTVRVSVWTSEVTASYTIEDAVLELVISLPKSFPLRLPQSGSVVDALTVFKKNISMHFDGIEDCAVCYSVVSAIDRALPNKQCKTCKNMFHGSCLYKILSGLESRVTWPLSSNINDYKMSKILRNIFKTGESERLTYPNPRPQEGDAFSFALGLGATLACCGISVNCIVDALNVK